MGSRRSVNTIAQALLRVGALRAVELLLAHESRQREAGDPRPASETPAEELARHGMDHAELGALALRHWLVPEPLPQFVQWHHAEPSTPLGGAALRLVGLLRDARTLLRCHDAGPATHDWPQSSLTTYRNDPHSMRHVARGALADARANLSLLRMEMQQHKRTG